MRAGRVTSIRVNPSDCMGVIDVVECAGVQQSGASFAMHVSLALSVCIETMRKNGLIPERTGYEYSEMMQRFEGNEGQKKRQLAYANSIHLQGSEFHVPSAGSISPREVVVQLPPYDPEGDISFVKYKPKVQDWTPEEIKIETRRQQMALSRQGYKMPGENVLFDPAAVTPSGQTKHPRFTMPGQREAYQDLQELIAKKQAALTTPDIYWSEHDEAELQRLQTLIFPEGVENG